MKAIKILKKCCIVYEGWINRLFESNMSDSYVIYYKKPIPRLMPLIDFDFIKFRFTYSNSYTQRTVNATCIIDAIELALGAQPRMINYERYIPYKITRGKETFRIDKKVYQSFFEENIDLPEIERQLKVICHDK